MKQIIKIAPKNKTPEQTKADAEERKRQKKLDERWGKEAIKAGWTAIPSVILERQASLGLDAMDLAIILHLVKHWWEAERNPYPSKRRVCEAMGISESTMRKHVAKLQKAGLLQRKPKFIPGTKGMMSNEYDLSGLVKRSTKLAQEQLENRKSQESLASRKRREKMAKKA